MEWQQDGSNGVKNAMSFLMHPLTTKRIGELDFHQDGSGYNAMCLMGKHGTYVYLPS